MMTELELKVVTAVIKSDYQDGDSPVDNPIWLIEECDVNMTKGQLAGAVSSCVKKGWVGHDDETIWMTENGMIEYIKTKIIKS
tara:strand:- start:38 stop:286 length:249 start_codon:yes stop_codon:yes gene_type:complete